MDGPTLWQFMREVKQENKDAHTEIIDGQRLMELRVRAVEVEQATQRGAAETVEHRLGTLEGRVKTWGPVLAVVSVAGTIAQALGIDVKSL